MAIYDNYSLPTYHDKDWSDVDWYDAMPDDCVALYELSEAMKLEWMMMARTIYLAGGGKEDIPKMTQYIWEKVVVASGMAEGPMDSHLYNTLYSHILFAGEMVRKDRMFQAMTDDELDEYWQKELAMREWGDEVVAPLVNEFMGDLDEKLSEIKQANDTRDAEIASLNALWQEGKN
jgi:hypothetical protein